MNPRILTDYPRRAHLEFFRRNPNPFYGLTFELDATAVRTAARAASASTYAAMVWAYHRALLGIDAFRTRLVGEDVVLHDSLRIGMTVPAPQRRFTFATLDFEDDARAFLARAAAVVDRAEQGRRCPSPISRTSRWRTRLPASRRPRSVASERTAGARWCPSACW
jgi:chloramphenicol O-acetyltransferase